MKTYVFFLFFIIVMFSGCNSPAYLSAPQDFKYHVKGLYLHIPRTDDEPRFLGEIIEVTPEDIKLLPVNRPGGIRTLSKEEVTSADVAVSLTSDNVKAIGLWAGFLNLASIAHGAYGIISLPINLAFTISIGQDAIKGIYRIKYPDNISWEELKKFARFPQGIPEYIDLNAIK